MQDNNRDITLYTLNSLGGETQIYEIVEKIILDSANALSQLDNLTERINDSRKKEKFENLTKKIYIYRKPRAEEIFDDLHYMVTPESELTMLLYILFTKLKFKITETITLSTQTSVNSKSVFFRVLFGEIKGDEYTKKVIKQLRGYVEPNNGDIYNIIQQMELTSDLQQGLENIAIGSKLLTDLRYGNFTLFEKGVTAHRVTVAKTVAEKSENALTEKDEEDLIINYLIRALNDSEDIHTLDRMAEEDLNPRAGLYNSTIANLAELDKKKSDLGTRKLASFGISESDLESVRPQTRIFASDYLNKVEKKILKHGYAEKQVKEINQHRMSGIDHDRYYAELAENTKDDEYISLGKRDLAYDTKDPTRHKKLITSMGRG